MFSSSPQKTATGTPSRNTLCDKMLLTLNRISLYGSVALSLLSLIVSVAIALIVLGLISLEVDLRWFFAALGILILPVIFTNVIINMLMRKHYRTRLEAPTTFAGLIVKRRFGWVYSPDKLEQWLGEMEEQGLALVFIRGISFYFARSRPREIKYCVDYQVMTDNQYYLNHTEAGWTLLYTTANFIGHWTIWAQECSSNNDQDSQTLKRDMLNLLLHSRRVALAYSLTFMPLIILNITGIKVLADITFLRGGSWDIYFSLILFGLLLLSIVICTVRVWLYYQRTRSHVKVT